VRIQGKSWWRKIAELLIQSVRANRPKGGKKPRMLEFTEIHEFYCWLFLYNFLRGVAGGVR
jgi:hypothetical protein